MPTTPNMNLLLPVPTVTPGPTYASENNEAFDLVDSHDHTPGKGVPIPSNGININNDLPYNGYNAASLRSTQFQTQVAPLSLPSDLSMLYVVNGNLYYNNQIGQQIQLTSGASLNASSIGGIGGDYTTSGALEFYTSAIKTFTFWSSTNVPANLDSASVTIRELVPSGNGITLSAPAGLASNYTLTLPSALPGASRALVFDSTGAGSFSTLPGAQITPGSITEDLLAPMPTGTTVGIGGFATSVSSYGFAGGSVGSFQLIDNQTVTITTAGRPVMLFPTMDGGINPSEFVFQTSSGPTDSLYLAIFRNGVQINFIGFPLLVSGVNPITLTIPGILACDPVPAGTYTYELKYYLTGPGTILYQNTVLNAYEI